MGQDFLVQQLENSVVGSVFKTDVIIVGAGVTGLALRRSLLSAGLKTCVLEKSRGVGGRMSVRRGEGWVADLGAQFTNANNPEWKNVLQSDLASVVPVRFLENGEIKNRFVSKKGLSAFSKALLASGNDVDDIFFSHRAESITRCGPNAEKWAILTQCGKRFEAGVLVLTAPLPQNVDLIKNSELPITSQCLAQLESVVYEPCLTLIAELTLPVPVLEFAILKNPSKALAGIYDQNAKGIEAENHVWIVHASPELSAELWNEPESTILSRLEKETEAAVIALGQKVTFKKLALHKWKFSQPVGVLKEPFLRVEFEKSSGPNAPLFLAGDSFQRPSVEGAFCSGLAAGEAVIASLISMGLL